MQIFDKHIHKDEFKLRILMTDDCNFNCSFCLNDFQKKPGQAPVTMPKYIDPKVVHKAINVYASNMGDKYPLQVYFSGGEPTLHPDLGFLIWFASMQKKCRVTVNTNGSFKKDLEVDLKLAHCLHFGVYSTDDKLASKIQRLGGSVQCVYSQSNPYVTLDFIKFYANYGLPIKVFGDLKEPHALAAYEEFAKLAVKTFPEAQLSFRFTGVQENRGRGCANCDRYCVTLKGAWVFPDGGVSHCPQKCKGEVFYPKNYAEWSDALEAIKSLHMV